MLSVLVLVLAPILSGVPVNNIEDIDDVGGVAAVSAAVGVVAGGLVLHQLATRKIVVGDELVPAGVAAIFVGGAVGGALGAALAGGAPAEIGLAALGAGVSHWLMLVALYSTLPILGIGAFVAATAAVSAGVPLEVIVGIGQGALVTFVVAGAGFGAALGATAGRHIVEGEREPEPVTPSTDPTAAAVTDALR